MLARLPNAVPAFFAFIAIAGCSPKEEAAAPEAGTPAAAAAPAPVREITQISGDLYRVRNNAHYTVFLVTPEGIILGDPISTDAATWLKGELAERFKVPVRYVVYSHHHWDHAAGGAVFNDTAELIGHENMPGAIQAYSAGLGGDLVAQDRNGNNQLERDEAQGGMAAQFDFFDRNRDGGITAAEIIAEVVPPESTYSGSRTLSLGGKTVQLIHPGNNHSTDSTVMYFPAERAAFGVDFIGVKRLPGGLLGGGTYDEWISSLKAVEALDFDSFLPGHGPWGSKADVAAFRQYGEGLRTAVLEGIKAGRTVDELKASILMEPYREFENYGIWREQTIEQAYQLLKEGA